MRRIAMPSVTSWISAEWRDLVMLSYEVDPLHLVPLVPAGTSLDFHEGRTLVTVTGFRFLNARLAGMPVPLHQDFGQVNLRFYVWRQAGSAIRRGVVFISDIVPSVTVTAVARLLFNEKYVVAPMRYEAISAEQGWASYEWQVGGRWHRLAATRSGVPRQPAPRSVESFVVDRPWSYSRQRDGSTLELHVEHPTWDVWPAADPRLECDVATVFGSAFATALSRPPLSAVIAAGSPTILHAGERLD
jgi:uncharacterized protein YqjF (DUF2071 family)